MAININRNLNGRQYDRENHTNYFNMMYCYLLNGMNSRLTAAKMNMDYDKFCNSIKEIEDICEINWYNGNVLASILTSFKIANRKTDI